MKLTRLGKVALVPVVAAVLLTSGCSTEQVAAHVGSDKVTTNDVDVLSDTQCTLVKGSPQQQGAVTMRVLHNASLEALVHMEVVKQLIDSKGAGAFDAELYRQQIQGADQALAKMPDDERARAIDLLQTYTKRELQLQHLAEQRLRAQGTAQPSQDQVQQEMTTLYNDFRKTVEVKVSPAYSPDKNGKTGSEDGSLSVPVSSYAKQAERQQPDAAFTASLPSRLRCG